MTTQQRSTAPAAPSVLAEVLRLSMLEGLSVRAISRRLQLARKTVRKMLTRAPLRTRPAPEPARGSVLDLYDPQIRRWLEDTPELKAPAVLERLRPLG